MVDEGTTPGRRRGPALPWLAAALCLLPVPLYAVVRGFGGVAPAVLLYLAVATLMAVVAVVGVRRLPRDRRRPWALLAASQGLFLTAEVAFIVAFTGVDVGHRLVPEILFLSGYAVLLAGVLALVRQPTGRSGRAALLDAAIVTLSCAAVLGTFFVAPLLADSDMPLQDRIVAGLYPLADIGIVYVLARTVLLPGHRAPAAHLLLAGLGVLVVADVASYLERLAGSGGPSTWAATGWLLSRGLISVAICCSSAVRLPAPPTAERPTGLTTRRLLVLALAAALPSGLSAALGLLGHRAHPVLLGCAALVLVLLVSLRTNDLLGQLRQQAAQLAVQARTDALTGLANRRTWDFHVARASAAARVDGTPLAVALLDLDHFKRFNDSFGHDAGDDLLREAAVAWTAALGRGVTLARWGGEEFAVLLPGLDAERAAVHLSAVHEAVPRGQTCSIGVTVLADGEEPADAMRRADEALYAAKHAGRACTVVAAVPSSSPDREAVTR
ncbi:diguanylate cyclase (GGDEF)-like protein [Kineococcus xinjiangensis]|uniref:Diguanylate cyclase (GGDEF)-like protein n=1 Tax=Kineococcus xinjiangensis TaxID=512762 RepID=A0A2S6IG35_9ACTN|nr:GGDEF domain-containing protein [Kineococcus xinjiangensis]PPK93184.1 diguanylate cyclase (GGDEF)-like protein [Kineococcus xinjiangensis]